MLASDPDAFERATHSFGESAPYDVAVANAVAANVLGGPRAVGWLTQALTVFQTGGLEADASRARQLLRGLGGVVPRARRTVRSHPFLHDCGVTPREGEVLTLVARGMTNAEIAEQLFLSPRTVQTHVSSLLSKLHAQNRAGLIALGLSVGAGSPHLEAARRPRERRADTATDAGDPDREA